ncbi:MAG: HNH endonuclease [Dorea sp.]|nr:HNH endonuclease [Dorea sp.]
MRNMELGPDSEKRNVEIQDDVSGRSEVFCHKPEVCEDEFMDFEDAAFDKTRIIREVVDQNVTTSILPKKGGHWSETDVPGDSAWVLDDDVDITWSKGGEKHSISGRELKDKYGINEVQYSGGEPDFAPFEDKMIGHVELDEFSDCRTGKEGTYSCATRAAADALGWTPKDVDEYMEKNGLTWHECGDRMTVRAVPAEINAAFKHTGGISIEKSLRAMEEEIQDRYGKIKLEKKSLSGTVSSEEVGIAADYMRGKYRERKRR